MNPASENAAWQRGYESGIEDALRAVDSMRGSGAASLATPIILRVRAELIALRECNRVNPAA